MDDGLYCISCCRKPNYKCILRCKNQFIDFGESILQKYFLKVFSKYYFILYLENTFVKYFILLFSKYFFCTILFSILKILLKSILPITGCLSHGSTIIRFVVLHGIMDTRGFSFIGCNVSYCMNRYDISLHDVFNHTFAKFIYAYVQRMYSTVASTSVEFLLKTINLRDGLLILPDNTLTFNKINNIIDFMCTA
jgi:hypothetical protein